MASEGYIPLETSPAQEQTQEGTQEETTLSSKLLHPLYLTHALSTTLSRTFEFHSILLLSTLYPTTLLPLSIYALSRSLFTILLAPLIGTSIDTRPGLALLRFSILIQRTSIILSTILFFILLHRPTLTPLLLPLTLLSALEKSASSLSFILLERSWLVLLAPSPAPRAILTSNLRRIDLIAKLAGPLVIASLHSAYPILALATSLSLSTLAWPLEHLSAGRIWALAPCLRAHSPQPRPTPCVADIRMYARHAAFLPSVSLALLYATVLSFGGQMVGHLSGAGWSGVDIGLARTAAVASEVSATVAGPAAMRRVGAVRAGLWFVAWLMGSVGVAALLFVRGGRGADVALVGGTVLSRVGLWGFDLSAAAVVQDEVEEEVRGAFSAAEAACQNACEMLAYVSTMVWSRPEQFRYPVLMSAVAVWVAGGLFAKAVRTRRGHLLHIAECVKGRELLGSK